MENQHRLWHRLLSRLRGRTSSFHFSAGPQRSRRHSQRPRTGSNTPGRYSFYLGGHSSSDHGCFHPFQEGNGFTNIDELSFTPKFLSHVTPRCLTDIDTQDILLGRGTYDDFSPNCWLENHLHRFGMAPGVNERDSQNQSNTDSTQEDSVSSSAPGISLNPNLQSFLGQVSSSLTSPSVHSSSDSSNSMNPCDTCPGSSDTTISDISHLYNNMALTGFSFAPDSIFPEPPPYSEFPDDPPPPYSEVATLRPRQSPNSLSREVAIFRPNSNRAPSSLTRRASNVLNTCDILW